LTEGSLKYSWLLRIYVGEDDRFDGKPLYKEIVRFLRERGFSGATVFRGIYGFGKKSQLHSASVLRLSSDLPILIEVVESDEKIMGVLAEIKGMVKEGLVTLERIVIVKHEG